MKHVINVAVEKIQLQTKAADNNLCSYCHQLIPKIVINGKTCRNNRIDLEDENEKLVSYHPDCYDVFLLGHIHPSTIHLLYCIEVLKKFI